MSLRGRHRDKTNPKKAKGLFKGEPLKPERLRWTRAGRLQSFYQGLERLGLEKLGVLTAFFDGTLGDYVNTEKGKEELDRLANDEGLFANYLKGLRIPGATKLMADFLKTAEGVEAFVRVGRIQSGLTVLVKIGQTPEGRRVARHMLLSPFRGWPAMFRILGKLGEETEAADSKEEDLPSIDLSPFTKSKDPVKELLPLIRKREALGPIFISLSESDENAKLCCRILKEPAIRKCLFDYLTCNPEGSAETFKKLFRSEERRRRISDIFMSGGGTKLLVDLAGDVQGRALMTRLAISPHGRKTGIKVLLFHPITIIRVGWSYFREPRTGQL